MLEKYFLPGLATLIRQSSIITPKISTDHSLCLIVTAIGNVLTWDESKIIPENLLQGMYNDNTELRGVISAIHGDNLFMLLTNNASVVLIKQGLPDAVKIIDIEDVIDMIWTIDSIVLLCIDGSVWYSNDNSNFEEVSMSKTIGHITNIEDDIYAIDIQGDTYILKNTVLIRQSLSNGKQLETKSNRDFETFKRKGYPHIDSVSLQDFISFSWYDPGAMTGYDNHPIIGLIRKDGQVMVTLESQRSILFDHETLSSELVSSLTLLPRVNVFDS